MLPFSHVDIVQVSIIAFLAAGALAVVGLAMVFIGAIWRWPRVLGIGLSLLIGNILIAGFAFFTCASHFQMGH